MQHTLVAQRRDDLVEDERMLQLRIAPYCSKTSAAPSGNQSIVAQ